MLPYKIIMFNFRLQYKYYFMQQNSTSELLVKHLYNETSTNEANAVSDALAQDNALQQEFNQLSEAKYALDETDGETPDISIIQKIMKFSKQQELTETH